MELFITALGKKRYRGFAMVNIREIDKEDCKCCSWVYRKYDLYLVAVDDGDCLYELGKGK